jgi:hypothetical protein
LPEPPKIEVPARKVVEITYEPDTDRATLKWDDRTTQEVIVLELVWGPQGTWARLTPLNNPTYVICVTQSATMPPETYIVYETPVIPDEPPQPISEQAPPPTEEVTA